MAEKREMDSGSGGGRVATRSAAMSPAPTKPAPAVFKAKSRNEGGIIFFRESNSRRFLFEKFAAQKKNANELHAVRRGAAKH
jgi:hypothetical protein